MRARRHMASPQIRSLPRTSPPIRKFKEVDSKRLLNEEEWYVIILFVYKT